ncbi:hypothetical protein K501DRAFT_144619, partial [Backusella circina FSU 941]
VVYAIHNFEAENEDEITFQFGEPIIILEKDDQFMDGWWQGRNIYGQSGLFPINYTSPKKPSLSRITRKKRYSERMNNTGVYRCASGSTETLVHKNEGTNDEMLGINRKSPLDWSVEEVIAWLESVGLEIVVCNFIDQEISGDVLLNLTHDGLKELGISIYGRRYRVINAIENLKSIYSEEYDDHNTCAGSGRHDMYRCSPTADTRSTTDSISLNSPLFPKQPRKYKIYNYIYSGFFSEENHYKSPLKPSFLHSHDSLTTTLTSSTISNSRSTISVNKKSSLDQRSTITQSVSTFDDLYKYNITKSDSPELEGWMYKRSERFKTWNKRWFTLQNFNLIYFKNSKDTKAKGIIHLNGYKVIPDTISTSGKKYSFKLHHEREKDFQFYTEDLNTMKKWTQALMKTTIKRDVYMPVVSSSNQCTVPLDIAQQMKPRPPSIIMYKQSNTEKKLYSSPSFVQTEELDETFDYTSLLNPGQWCEDHLLEWINSHLEHKIENLSQSFCSGDILLELLESISGEVINYTNKNPTKSMDILDNIAVAFKFMNQIGIEADKYTIKDIFSGNKNKIIDMLITIKYWS